MVKRQFVRIHPFQNKEERLVQQHQQRQGGLLSRTEWSPITDGQPRVPSTTDGQPCVTSATDTNSVSTTYTSGMGLLSSWKAMRGAVQHNITDTAGFNSNSRSKRRRGKLFSYAGQSGLASLPSQAEAAPNMPVGGAMGAMPVMDTMAPTSPPVPGQQRADPFGLPVVPPQTDVWSWAWTRGPQDTNAGYPPSPGYQGNQGYPAYAYPGPQPPPGFYRPLTKVKKRKKRHVPIWARVILIFVLLLLLTAGAGTYYYEVNFATSVSHITGQQVPRLKGDVDPNQTGANGGDILSGGRINILLLGSDTDQKFDGAYLAQTDIVVTIDPQTKYVGMLSIPRDTWLQGANGAGMMKLDQAYSLGGVALSRATIYQDFGIPINYYAWVGLDGFIKVVDTVNGVDIDALHAITDDAYPNDTSGSKDVYGYKRLYIAPGPQHMDGQTALEYVRSRHADLVGDFGRSQRQQQLLSALKLKLNNSNVVGELPQIANDLNGYVKTDMQLTDVFKLMNFARTINQGQIKQVVLDGQYSRTVSNYQPGGGQDIVALNCPVVQPVIAQMFGLGDQARCDTGMSSIGTPTSTALTQSSPFVSPSFTIPVSSGSAWQVARQMTEVNSLSYSDGSSSLLGVRSLIDLLCFTVFESPIGMQA